MNESFDLEKSIVAWRAECTTGGPLPDGNLDELETHLRDAFDDLRGHGLADDEAFYLARRRLGGAELAPEFAKVHADALWAERAKWMLFGVLCFDVGWGTLRTVGSVIQAWLARWDFGQASFLVSSWLTALGALGVFGYALMRLVRGRWRLGGLERYVALRHPAVLAVLVGAMFVVEKFAVAVRYALLRQNMDSYGFDERFVTSQYFDFGLGLITLLLVAVASTLAMRRSRRVA